MPRIKISEFKAKQIISPFLGIKYQGIEVNKENVDSVSSSLNPDKKYVLKVDQGVKKRNKSGLVAVDIKSTEIKSKVQDFLEKGYSRFLLEEFIKHDKSEEKFLALELTREGVKCYYSTLGGVNIEEGVNKVKNIILSPKNLTNVAKDLEIKHEVLEKFIEAFDKLHLSFLETNPFLTINNEVQLLDLAVEVDSAAEFFVNNKWDRNDFIDTAKNSEPEEVEIKKLAEGSSASFKFVVINPKGSIFTIFSGGGASIVLADEIGNIGKGHELANYAEYSGGPTEDETYIFSRSIISLALRSPAKNKKLYIAGGVANFTDIRATFKGVIKALDEKKEELKKENVKVYVRRGGPYQEEGLAMMDKFLKKAGLTGEVMGPDRVLTEVITMN